MLFCERPHVKEVDFGTARFVVSTASGLNVSGKHLVRGDEVPRGVLTVEALRQIYEPPLRLIETVTFAQKDPSLVAACSERGTTLDLDPSERDQSLGLRDDADALQMCDECGEMYPDLSHHSRKQCRNNQRRSK
jgi:hypothetical protein